MVSVDGSLDSVNLVDYLVVLLLGGVVNGDVMCLLFEVCNFVCVVNDVEKFIVFICYGGWLLILVGIVKGCIVISWFSL